MSRFITFDVETPNRLNHRMSAIGISVIDNGAITENFYSLLIQKRILTISTPG